MTVQPCRECFWHPGHLLRRPVTFPQTLLQTPGRGTRTEDTFKSLASVGFRGQMTILSSSPVAQKPLRLAILSPAALLRSHQALRLARCRLEFRYSSLCLRLKSFSLECKRNRFSMLYPVKTTTGQFAKRRSLGNCVCASVLFI